MRPAASRHGALAVVQKFSAGLLEEAQVGVGLVRAREATAAHRDVMQGTGAFHLQALTLIVDHGARLLGIAFVRIGLLQMRFGVRRAYRLLDRDAYSRPWRCAERRLGCEQKHGTSQYTFHVRLPENLKEKI